MNFKQELKHFREQVNTLSIKTAEGKITHQEFMEEFMGEFDYIMMRHATDVIMDLTRASLEVERGKKDDN